SAVHFRRPIKNDPFLASFHYTLSFVWKRMGSLYADSLLSFSNNILQWKISISADRGQFGFATGVIPARLFHLFVQHPFFL
ncbi:hypothetical protein, partial [Thermoactinomyces daqus]|uniref:hypothetical protein n=1 Tax=Thermoactinomyces daqus TaxID=1329516 RepID=UPI001C68997A